jgi:hypothetical protein
LSGYSDQFQIKKLDRLSLNNTIVMEVRPEWSGRDGRPNPAHLLSLYLRGMSLNYYDQKSWTSTHQERELIAGGGITEVYLPSQTMKDTRELKLTVDQQSSQAERLFGASIPHRFQIDLDRKNDHLPLKYILQAQTVQFDLTTAHFPGFSQDRNFKLEYSSYSFYQPDEKSTLWHLDKRLAKNESGNGRKERPVCQASAISHPDRWEVIRLLGDRCQVDQRLVMDPRMKQLHTQLPDTDLSETIRRLARKHCRADNNAGKIIQILDWFDREFEYTLQRQIRASESVIEAFLTRTRKGHCENYACALALLLRSQGIPARIVTGFYTDE